MQIKYRLAYKTYSCHYYLHYRLVIQSIQNGHLFIVSYCILARSVPVKMILMNIYLTWRYSFINEDTQKALLRIKWKKSSFPLEIKFRESRVRPYHFLLKKLEGILHKNNYLLNMNAEVKQTFTPCPLVLYRS